MSTCLLIKLNTQDILSIKPNEHERVLIKPNAHVHANEHDIYIRVPTVSVSNTVFMKSLEKWLLSLETWIIR